MKKLLIIAAAAVACAFVSSGAEAKAATKAKVAKFNIIERTEAKEFTGKDGKVFRYRIAEKASADGSKIPLVIFLHGAGERGTNNQAQLVHGVGDLVRWMDQREKGYRLIAGQVPF